MRPGVTDTSRGQILGWLSCLGEIGPLLAIRASVAPQCGDSHRWSVELVGRSLPSCKYLLLCIVSDIVCLCAWYLGTASYVDGWKERQEIFSVHSRTLSLASP